MNYSIGPRYGKALLKIATATQQVDTIQGELRLFLDLLTKNPLLKKTLLSPMFSLSQREELLHGVAGRLSLSSLLSLFLKHLLQKKHLSYLGHICESYQLQAETMMQKRRGVVMSAISLSQDQREEIHSQLQRASRHKLLLDFQVNPEVLGGMRIQIGSLRFDGTIAQQLETMRGHLLANTADVVQSMVKL